MNCLLDTHAFLWSVFAPDKLGRKARAAISDGGNEICLSSVSLWEISLRYSLGKLTLEDCTPEDLLPIAADMQLTLIAPDAEEAVSFHRLPRAAHRDPFDRMLAWQSLRRHLVMITRDAALPAYRDAGLETLW